MLELNETEQMEDYKKYRGKCREFCEQAILEDPSLKLVRGYYHCPFWGKQEHWWTVREDGSIFDPTVKQFPTAGAMAEYEEFNGMCECAECGKEFEEGAPESRYESRYAFCSGACLFKFVGIW